jgi:hypothetical protein
MDCCDAASESGKAYPRQAVCPVNGKTYKYIPRKTLLQHVRFPLNQHLLEQGYYFCSSPQCDVVYFGEDGAVISSADIRESVGQKRVNAERTLCYCFDITDKAVHEEIAAHGYSPSYHFVVSQTRQANCACESRNPSGRCCLKDFPRAARNKISQQ